AWGTGSGWSRRIARVVWIISSRSVPSGIQFLLRGKFSSAALSGAVLIVLSRSRLGYCRAHRRQSLQGTQDFRLIVGEMAYEDVGVPDFPEGPKLLRDFVDRSRDQGFCRHAAIAPIQRLLQQRLRLGGRLADINVAPQDDGVRLFAVGGTALTIEIGLCARLRPGEAGARDPAFRQPCRAADGWRCTGA